MLCVHGEDDRRFASISSSRKSLFAKNLSSCTNEAMTFDPHQFERLAIKRISEIASEEGLNYKQHAEKAGLSKSADVTWRAIRNQGQKLTLSDMVTLLNVLKVKPASVLFEVQEMMKKQDKQDVENKGMGLAAEDVSEYNSDDDKDEPHLGNASNG
jgi:hypothetical protein